MLSTGCENGGSTSEQFTEREWLAKENWKPHLEFVNNFLIENSIDFPFAGNEESCQNIAIAYALVKRAINDRDLLFDLQLRLKRTNEELKNYQNLASKYQASLDQWQKDCNAATTTAKIANENLEKLQAEYSALLGEHARLKGQHANKEKLFLVDIRRKEREIERIKDQLASSLKGAYKHIDVNSFFIEPSVTNFGKQPKSGGASEADLWKEMLQRMEEKDQSRQNAFGNLKNLLNNVYFSIASLAGMPSSEILHPVELNSFDERQSRKTSESFGLLLKRVKQLLLEHSSLAPSANSPNNALEMRIAQLEQETVALRAGLMEKDLIIQRANERLQLSLKNETCKLEQERNTLGTLKQELDVRSKKLDDDNKKLMEMTIKYYQERKLFLQEKEAFESKQHIAQQ